MRKIASLITLVILFSFAITVLAQTSDLPSPGLTPDSPFYFLDTLGEKIGMFFTFGTEKKAEKALKYADEKIAEVKVMAEKNKAKALEKANQKYQEFLNLANKKAQEAKEKGEDIERRVTLISEKTLKHQEVLREVFEKVPEEAKKGIENAIKMSIKGFETAVRAVTGEKKEELQRKAEEVKSRIEEKIEAGPAATSKETPEVCIQVITPAISSENVCKEFPTPCDVPADWKKVDRCPQPTVAPLPVPVSTPAPTQAPIPVPAKTSAPATLVACCNASGGCKLVDTKETCLGMSFKPMSISS